MQRIRVQMNREVNYLGQLDFWRGRTDMAARCGHVISASDVRPRDICKITHYGPIDAAFLDRI